MITLREWLEIKQVEKLNLIEIRGKIANLDDADRFELMLNIELLTSFSVEAHRVAKRRDHYSARTIIEVLRHNSLVEDNDPEYKINNNIAPLLARLSMELFPALNGLFSIRLQTSKVK